MTFFDVVVAVILGTLALLVAKWIGIFVAAIIAAILRRG